MNEAKRNECMLDPLVVRLSDSVTIIHADCRDVLPVPCDAVVTDPPYGVGLEYGYGDDTPQYVRECVVSDVLPKALQMAKRVIVTTGIRNMFDYPRPTWVLGWFAPGGTGCGPWGFVTWQPVFAYGKDPYLAAGKGSRPDCFIEAPDPDVPTPRRTRDAAVVHFKRGTVANLKYNHPCQKSENVMRWLVERTSMADETVCDPYMGSGTTGVACIRTGRRFVGVEIDAGYFDTARKRLERELAQGRLF